MSVLNCSIKFKRNKLKRIQQLMPKILEETVEEILKNIRTTAIRLERGNNEEGILIELIDVANNQVKGRVYTSKENMPWAMFEHFGTGDFRELDPVGVTKHFLETGGSQWFIPVEKAPKELHYPIIEIQGSQFYVAHGVKANHFMSDAKFTTRNENKEIVKRKIEEMIREACR